jgi:polysaccharide export outer membrane protein
MKGSSLLVPLFAIGLALLASAAWAQVPAPPPAAPPPASPTEYQIGSKDLLEVRVLELPELSVERRVSDNGTLDLPLLGEIPVAGLTAAEVQNRLEQLLTAKYVNRANVSVIVKEFNNKPISVLGAVQRPGSLPISGRWTLMKAITTAGGLTERAGHTILVLRRAENGLSDTLEIDTRDLFQSATPLWNIPIQPADVINVPPRTTITVFCLGEVKTPGALQFDSEDRLTLLSVIAKAGGLSDRASKSIRIKHRGEDGKDVEKVVDFKRILSGDEPDAPIAPNDVVVVKESFF